MNQREPSLSTLYQRSKTDLIVDIEQLLESLRLAKAENKRLREALRGAAGLVHAFSGHSGFFDDCPINFCINARAALGETSA